jgi:hypothetical protein
MENQVKATAKYLVQQAARQRFSFGPTWNAAVLAGEVKDTNKLVAHAVKLQAGRKSDLKKLKFATLLAKVQAKLMA